MEFVVIAAMGYREKLEFGGPAAQTSLPLPLGEVPPKGAERALSVTAKAVPAPPKGEPRPHQIPICRDAAKSFRNERAHFYTSRLDVLCGVRFCDAPKPPLCKGRWHGEAVTEGLSTIDGLNPLRRCAPNACGHSGARPLDAIKGSLSGGQSRPPLQPSPVSLCRKEILKKILRDCNLDILWYTVRE